MQTILRFHINAKILRCENDTFTKEMSLILVYNLTVRIMGKVNHCIHSAYQYVYVENVKQ